MYRRRERIDKIWKTESGVVYGGMRERVYAGMSGLGDGGGDQ